MADLYPGAIRRLDDKVAATFVGWKIREAYGIGVLEDFMQLLTQSDLPAGHPVRPCSSGSISTKQRRRRPPKSAKAKLKLNGVKTVVLAMRAFHFWHEGRMNVRRLDPRHGRSVPADREAGGNELAAAAE